jgi:hypothetical protein
MLLNVKKGSIRFDRHSEQIVETALPLSFVLFSAKASHTHIYDGKSMCVCDASERSGRSAATRNVAAV